MKKIILLIVALLSLGAGAQDNGLFQLPIVPENITTLQDRSDYLVEHYWDFCDLGKAFSQRDKMADAFDVYLSLMPYASAEKVFESVDKFMDKINKGPDVLFIADLAEQKLYGDSAEYASDELYLKFLDKIVANKKVDKNSKLRYQHQQRVLSRSQIGMPAPEFEYIDIDGHKGKFVNDSTKIGTMLFFNDPDCTSCSMARLRLDADVQATRLTGEGYFDIYSVYPGEADEQWKAMAADYPASWRVVASPEVDEIYDLRSSPSFYLINPDGKILFKTDNVDLILDIMARLGAGVRYNRNKTTNAANSANTVSTNE